jgi:hypothetical protein
MHFPGKLRLKIFLCDSQTIQYLEENLVFTLEITSGKFFKNERRTRTFEKASISFYSLPNIYKLINNCFILFQLHVPVQLPCYDFIQIANLSMGFIKTFKQN